jgi:hypothetical protein
VAAGPDNALWAVGKYYDSKTAAPHTMTVRYQSGKWAQVPSPTPGSADDWLYSAVITPGGQVWAVGAATSSTCETSLAEEYAGGAWKVMRVPDRGACASSNANALYGVTATSTGTLYAVGQGDISSWWSNTPRAPGRSCRPGTDHAHARHLARGPLTITRGQAPPRSTSEGFKETSNGTLAILCRSSRLSQPEAISGSPGGMTPVPAC